VEATGHVAGRGLLEPVSPRRRRTDRLARAILGAAAVIALVPLVLILYYLLKRGIGVFSLHFFTSDPSGAFLGDPGGIKSAICGTVEIVGFAALIAIPVGLGVALYLTEFGGSSRLASVVRFFVDVMTGVPSIVFGLFIYITLVVTGIGGESFAGWKGAVALALLMLPIVTRSSEVILQQVPSSLREAALALGAPRWRVVLRVVIPTALPGLVTGSLLSIARAAGETAPLLFTAAAVSGTTFSLGERMNSLPMQIFQDLRQPRDELVNVAWGAALTLVLMILLLTLIARLIQRRSRMQGAQ
jgi:phosphate transport system permease protein